MERIQDFFCMVSKKIFIVLQFFIVGGILLEFGRGTFDVFPLYYQLPNFILALIGLSTISILLVMFYGGGISEGYLQEKADVLLEECCIH